MTKKKSVFIELTSAVVFGGVIKRAGTVVECSDAQAKDLLHRGRGQLAAGGNAEDAGNETGGDEKPLGDHTVAELKEIAAEYEIDGYDGMKKADLVAAIEQAEAKADGGE